MKFLTIQEETKDYKDDIKVILETLKEKAKKKPCDNRNKNNKTTIKLTPAITYEPHFTSLYIKTELFLKITI